MESELKKRREKLATGISKGRRIDLLNQRRLESEFMNSPVAILPTLILNHDADMLEQLLDELTFLEQDLLQKLGLSQMSLKAFTEEADGRMKMVLFKLINRMRMWHAGWLEEAFDWLMDDASMLKQLAIYVESHDPEHLSQLKEQQVKTLVMHSEQCSEETFPMLMAVIAAYQKLLEASERARFIPFLMKTLQNSDLRTQTMTLQLIKSFQADLPQINEMLLQQWFQLVKIAEGKDAHSSSLAFELIADLISKDDTTALLQFLKEERFEEVMKKHLSYSFAPQRRTAYWAYSNLAASEDSIALALKLLPILLTNYPIEKQLHERAEILYGLVNLIYLAATDDLEQILKQEGALEVVLDSLESDLPDLIAKCLEALYFASQKSKPFRIHLQRGQLESRLQQLLSSNNEDISHRCDKLLEALTVHDSTDQ